MLPLLLVPLMALLCSSQRLTVRTLVHNDHSASTTLQLLLRNDAATAQRADVSLTLPDSAYSLMLSATLATSTAQVAKPTQDEKGARKAFNDTVAAGKMKVLADVKSTCDKCVDVDVNVPARNTLTIVVAYNETLADPEVCVPDVRINLLNEPAIKSKDSSFSVSVSGSMGQPNMEAQLCDISQQSDTCQCVSSPEKPKVTDSSASLDWKPFAPEDASGLRVCTYFNWLVTDTVSIANDESAPGSHSQYVVFLLDTSENLDDKDIGKIKEIFTNETKNLKATDSFSVVNYDGNAQVWTKGKKEIFAGIEQNFDDAIRHVEALKKGVGASLVTGLSRALELVARAKAKNQVCSDRASVVLLTGWTPPGGDADVRRAVRWLTQLNRLPHVALYVVGVGHTVHTCGLQELATSNGGKATQLHALQPVASLVSMSRKPQQKPQSVPQYLEPTIYNMTVYSRVEMRYAITVITSKVYNGANYSQEVVFSSVLPENAFVSNFTMEVDGKVYQSEVVKKGTQPTTPPSSKHSAKVDMSARDSNVILIALNLAARGEIIFTLTYEELLQKENGFYTLRLNVDPRQVVENLLVAVRIKDMTPITSLRYQRPTATSNNEIDFASYLPQTDFAINWQPDSWEQERMLKEGSRQLVVRFQLDQSVAQRVLVTNDGYFVHFFSPAGLAPVRKHVVFTLDVSSSMSGRKIEQMKEAFSVILGDLLPTDTFSLVQFESSVKVWSNGNNCQDLTNNVKVATVNEVAAARACVSEMRASGGTNLIDALDRSISSAQQQHKTTAAEGIVILLTDGNPDGGRDKVLTRFRSMSVDGVVLFCLALGDDADFALLQELSATTGGFARKIYVARDTVSQLRNFYRAIASIVLSNIKFSYGGAVNTTEQDFRAFLNGTDIVVAGKLTAGSRNLQPNFNSKQGSKDLNLCEPIIVRADFDNVDKLRAFLMVKQLSAKDQQKALQTALQYKFLTPLTSLVVNKPGGSSTVDITPVNVVEGAAQPPPPQPKLCDTYEATTPSENVVNKIFNSGYSLSDLTWPWQHLQVLPMPLADSNAAFGPCWTSDLETGHCRHLIHCILPVFVDNYTRFEADRCDLSGGFVGVCCPDSLVLKLLPQ